MDGQALVPSPASSVVRPLARPGLTGLDPVHLDVEEDLLGHCRVGGLRVGSAGTAVVGAAERLRGVRSALVCPWAGCLGRGQPHGHRGHEGHAANGEEGSHGAHLVGLEWRGRRGCWQRRRRTVARDVACVMSGAAPCGRAQAPSASAAPRWRSPILGPLDPARAAEHSAHARAKTLCNLHGRDRPAAPQGAHQRPRSGSSAHYGPGPLQGSGQEAVGASGER